LISLIGSYYLLSFSFISWIISLNSSISFCCSSILIEEIIALQTYTKALDFLASISPFKTMLATVASDFLTSFGVLNFNFIYRYTPLYKMFKFQRLYGFVNLS